MPGQLVALSPRHTKAHRAWVWCSSYGRDSKDHKLRIEAIIKSVSTLGGSLSDIDKITDYIEPIFNKINGTKE